MSKRPRPPDDLPASNGHPGPAAAASPSADDPPADDRPADHLPADHLPADDWPSDDRRDALTAILAARWAVILKRFRDYMNRG